MIIRVQKKTYSFNSRSKKTYSFNSINSLTKNLDELFVDLRLADGFDDKAHLTRREGTHARCVTCGTEAVGESW